MQSLFRFHRGFFSFVFSVCCIRCEDGVGWIEYGFDTCCLDVESWWVYDLFPLELVIVRLWVLVLRAVYGLLRACVVEEESSSFSTRFTCLENNGGDGEVSLVCDTLWCSSYCRVCLGGGIGVRPLLPCWCSGTEGILLFAVSSLCCNGRFVMLVNGAGAVLCFWWNYITTSLLCFI